MEALGIDSLDLGLPGAGQRAVEAVTALAREIVAHKMKIRANCAARTHENDIRPMAEIVQKTGLPIEAATFIGSSPIRRFTEGWTDDFLMQTTEKAVKYAVSLGLDVMYVTEDTSRCDPETVKRLYSTAINCGARAICICDTAGHATPMGALCACTICDRGMRQAVRREDSRGLARPQRSWPGDCELHGGGHRRRALRARMRDRLGRARWQYAGRPDASELETDGHCPVGRAGSDQAETVLPGGVARDGRAQFRRTIRWSAMMRFAPRPACMHRRSSRRITRDDVVLANTVYSGVPSHVFGLDQIIDIGPMSGKSNVLWWLERHGIPVSDGIVDRIYQRAKQSDHTLSEAEILECLPTATEKK